QKPTRASRGRGSSGPRIRVFSRMRPAFLCRIRPAPPSGKCKNDSELVLLVSTGRIGMDARFQRDPNQEELIMRSKLMAAVFVAVMAVPVSGAYAQEALDPALQQQLTAALTGTPEQVADQLDQLLDDNPAMAEAII